ncbi:hypothetical protein [Bacteroides sp. UBA939]|uniref:hypothetical protein n=1 Tax=Bacteroides sp. UBA939 TaxID=1946092 RepID=UPI0025BDA65F|nr:hypothetical protein [Bacteroides sp. UBA939]
MKKIILFVLMTFIISVSMTAQNEQEEVIQVPRKSAETVYCELTGTSGFSGKSIKISFDFGEQGHYYRASDDNQLVDEQGKVIGFSSMISALNYMAKHGWKLHTAYSATVKGLGGAETYRYILTKELDSDQSIMDGITLLGRYKELKEKKEK